MSLHLVELAAAVAMQIKRSTTSASVAMSSAASDITPNCWNAKQHNSLLHTAGFNMAPFANTLMIVIRNTVTNKMYAYMWLIAYYTIIAERWDTLLQVKQHLQKSEFKIK